MNGAKIYLVDSGVLLDKSDAEFRAYSGVYGTKDYAFYDKAQYAISADSLEEVIREAVEQIRYPGNFCEGAYVVATYQGTVDELYPDMLTDFVWDGAYAAEDVVYSAKVENGEIVENFLQNEQEH